MSQFKKREEYRFWHSPLVLAVMFCLVVLFSYNTVGLIAKERETIKNKDEEQSRIDDLQSRQTELTSDIAKLSTDEGKEESIRDKFQVVKPGENMVVIVDGDPQAPAAAPAPIDHSFWGFIKGLFTKKQSS
jgi:cell division protein FtsB